MEKRQPKVSFESIRSDFSVFSDKSIKVPMMEPKMIFPEAPAKTFFQNLEQSFKDFSTNILPTVNAIGNTLNNAFSGFADLFGNRVNVIKDELQVLRDSAAADEERMKELNLLNSADYLARKKRNEKEIESKKKAAAEE